MLNPIRTAVSRKKRRFKQDGFDLDLAYITPQIIAMGFPSENMEGLYRNPMSEVVRFLDARHGSHYKVYNLCSEKSYDPAKFHGRVAHYPFDDHNAPPFALILPFCDDVKKWLAADTRNIAVVHCKAGKGRTGVMICAYLLHSGHSTTPEDAMAFYGAVRTSNGQGVTIPSQVRYIRYWHHALNASLVYTEVPLILTALTLFNLPFKQPVVTVVLSTQQGAAVSMCKELPAVVAHASSATDAPLEVVAMVSFPDPLRVSGDARLHVHVRDAAGMNGGKFKFHLWFNTAFVTLESDISSSSDGGGHRGSGGSGGIGSTGARSPISDKLAIASPLDASVYGSVPASPITLTSASLPRNTAYLSVTTSSGAPGGGVVPPLSPISDEAEPAGASSSGPGSPTTEASSASPSASKAPSFLLANTEHVSVVTSSDAPLVLVARKHELDSIHKDKRHALVPAEFRAELSFSPPSPSTTVSASTSTGSGWTTRAAAIVGSGGHSSPPPPLGMSFSTSVLPTFPAAGSTLGRPSPQQPQPQQLQQGQMPLSPSSPSGLERLKRLWAGRHAFGATSPNLVTSFSTASRASSPGGGDFTTAPASASWSVPPSASVDVLPTSTGSSPPPTTTTPIVVSSLAGVKSMTSSVRSIDASGVGGGASSADDIEHDDDDEDEDSDDGDDDSSSATTAHGHPVRRNKHGGASSSSSTSAALGGLGGAISHSPLGQSSCPSTSEAESRPTEAGT
ncbi:hypothetical protein BC828DRAFT_16760 [Blastocladiella britannica]|nr:hypothetical protein BC828DRAFT_16760 [Blastocladiella britannica]